MTPARFLILLAVLVLVLFGVSLAVRSRTGDPRANQPTDSWVSRLNKRFEEGQRIDPEKDFNSTCRTGRQLVIPKALGQCTVTVPVTSRSVRRAQLTLKGADQFRLEYRPSPEDAEAVPLKINAFKPDKPVKLVFQKNGGQLTLTRLGLAADSIIKID